MKLQNKGWKRNENISSKNLVLWITYFLWEREREKKRKDDNSVWQKTLPEISTRSSGLATKKKTQHKYLPVWHCIARACCWLLCCGESNCCEQNILANGSSFIDSPDRSLKLKLSPNAQLTEHLPMGIRSHMFNASSPSQHKRLSSGRVTFYKRNLLWPITL